MDRRACCCFLKPVSFVPLFSPIPIVLAKLHQPANFGAPMRFEK
jgi:hypothetical protein